MRSIGAMARDSGLSVSALRFYDGAGVLGPAWVDPVSGYRWYAPGQLAECGLLARLRRVAMPLTDVRMVLAGWSAADTDLVRTLLEAHLRRLEAGLSDARHELSAIRELLDDREEPMTTNLTTPVRLSLGARELAAALDAVRFAAGRDPALPVLSGVLFDLEDGTLQVVATDRYRLAVATAGASGHDGERVQFVVPAPLADAMRALLTGDEAVRLTLDGDRVTLEAGDGQAAGPRLGHEYPDYRRLVLLPAGRRVLVDVPVLRAAVETGPVRTDEVREPDGVPVDLSVLTVTRDGEVTVSAEGDEGQEHVAVNRAFLLDALTAGARDELLLEFGGVVSPLAIRRPDAEETFSILMPVRLDA